jgi:heme-degrading monooxygenase HmoA
VPTLPWTATPTPADADTVAEPLVMASRFRLRRYRDVLPFLRDAVRVRALVRRSPGALGVSLVARPLRREFATLSAWRDRASLDAMVRAEPHPSIMRRYRATMADSAFAFYAPAEYPPTWAEAESRLASVTTAAGRPAGRRAARSAAR